MNREGKPHYVSSLGLVYSILPLISVNKEKRLTRGKNHQAMKAKSINEAIVIAPGDDSFIELMKNIIAGKRSFEGSCTMLGNDRHTLRCIA